MVSQCESLYLPEILLCLLRALLLFLKLHFALSAGCIFCGVAVLPYAMIYAQNVCLLQQADTKLFDSES